MAAGRTLGSEISVGLRARGVEVIFGIPGVHNVELYRGIETAGIAHVLARHEQGAGFMADGYARATGKPGVCYLISGPGLTNAMTPLGQAYADSVPVLAISSCLDAADDRLGAGRLHEMRDQVGAAEAVCGWSRTAHDAKSAFMLIDRALGEFAAARPRPCHVTVPIPVLGAASAPAPAPLARPLRAQAPAAAVGRMAELLRGARRPLFIFGGGAVGGADAARALIAATGAASFVTFAGRGIVAPGTPGFYGSTLAHAGAGAAIGEADLVLAIGTALAETDIWRAELGHAAPLVRVDLDPQMLADRHRAELPVLGDAPAFLSALCAALGPHRGVDWDMGRIASRRKTWRAEVEAARPGIAAWVDALMAALPKEAMVYSDMTQFAYVAKEIADMPRPGAWHHPTGFGTLGYALPAAIGGKVGVGAAPVVAVAGDYGFQYTLQELGTAVELGLNLPIVIWDNGKLKEIEDCMAKSQIAPNAVIARNPDFGLLARAYGAEFAQPQTPGGLTTAITAALKARVPTIIRCGPAVC